MGEFKQRIGKPEEWFKVFPKGVLRSYGAYGKAGRMGPGGSSVS